ncbi:putative NADH:ubiquinone reductase (H(+)-translocating) [Lupinus albus]|uniref:Putative NADH:ubiquinone reductase (H(+)-translocating) n=1 Tax=Lupinus albus TaxID=3870 RepID=A0A6A4PHR5_LUPAL|nr:putative NADH:ubiquinone reductase (H(+)-translocating) [Lupinus albus]
MKIKEKFSRVEFGSLHYSLRGGGGGGGGGGGFIFLLMGILGIGLYSSNEPTLNFEMLTNRSYPVGLEIIFYIGFLIAFAVKSPIIPFHTWLPDTHGEAHYSTCMLLAGILLKMGAYGLVRINMELLPRAHSIFFINGNSRYRFI